MTEKKIRRTSIDEVSFDKIIVNILRFTILLSMVSLIKNQKIKKDTYFWELGRGFLKSSQRLEWAMPIKC